METNFYNDSRGYTVKDTLYSHDLSKIANILMKAMTNEIRITNVKRVYESSCDMEYIEIEYKGYAHTVAPIGDTPYVLDEHKESESKEISW